MLMDLGGSRSLMGLLMTNRLDIGISPSISCLASEVQ